MPKELVYGADTPYAGSDAQSVIGVHWGRDGDEYLTLSTALFNDDLKYIDGHGIGHKASGEEAKRREIWADGFHVSLDRKGVNKLIRNLRRARDQAFGRDE